MIKNNLRKRAEVSYYEPEEHDLDEYIFCTECGDYVVEYCAVHGSLLVIPDNKVCIDSTTSALVPRAALTIPDVFLHLAPSIIPGAGLGVFTTLTLPADVRFGPYTGDIKKDIASPYCWQIYTSSRALLHVVDAASPDRSNWMRYVNCSRHCNEQNLVAFQYRGEIYYRTLKIIPKNTELLIYYGTEYAKELGIDICGYNDPKKYVNYITKSVARDNDAVTNTSQEEATNEKDQNLQEELIKISFDNDTVTFDEVNNNSNILTEANYDCNDHTKTINDSKPYQIRDDLTKEIYYSFNSDNNCYENELNNADEKIENHQINSSTIDNFNSNEINTTIRDKEYNKPVYMLTEKGYIKCLICNYQSYTETGIKQHVKLHDPKREFECKICYHKYFSRHDLNRHITSVHLNRKRYQCSICNATFTKPNYLKNHLAKVHNISNKNQPHIIDENKNNYNLNSDNIQENIIVNDSKTYKENMHTDAKENETNFEQNVNTDELNYTGHGPNYNHSKPTDFDTNEKTELRQATTFIDQNIFIKNYQDYYTLDEIYAKCNICGYKTKSQDHIKRHLQLHDERRPFACHICKLRYNERKGLTRHINCVHQQQKETFIKKLETESRDKINESTTKDIMGFYKTTLVNNFSNNDMTFNEGRQNDNAVKSKDKIAETGIKIDNFEENINSELKYKENIDLTFECLSCDFNTLSEFAIQRHVNLHDSRRKDICHICNCRFKSGYSLKMHIISVHFGEKRFKCNLCEAKYANGYTLKNHIMNIHK